MITLRITSMGITRKAITAQTSQVVAVRACTLSTWPPTVTKMNWARKIAPMTIRKLRLRAMFSNTLVCSVRALKPLKVMAIMKVANTAEFSTMLSGSTPG